MAYFYNPPFEKGIEAPKMSNMIFFGNIFSDEKKGGGVKWWRVPPR